MANINTSKHVNVDYLQRRKIEKNIFANHFNSDWLTLKTKWMHASKSKASIHQQE